MNGIKISPSQLALKDLEIFYNSELLIDTQSISHTSTNFSIRKTVVAGAVILALNSPIHVKAENNVEMKNQYSRIIDIVGSIDNSEVLLMQEVEYLTQNGTSPKNFTQDEIEEMEIIDAYYKEMRSYYPPKKKIIL